MEFMSSLFKKIRSRKFLCLVAALFVACLFLFLFIYFCASGFDRNAVPLEKNWKITDSNSTYESVDLSDYKIPEDVKPGFKVVYENILGAEAPLRSTIKVRSYHSAISVFIDGECLYRYGYELDESDLVGCGFHYVNLPENVIGKKLKIIMEIRETAAAKTVLTVDLLSTNAVSDYSARHALSLCSGIFLGIFGIVMVCFGIFALGYRKSFNRLILIGFLAFLIGVWTLCYTKTIQVFSMNFALNTLLEYSTLYLGAVIFELILLKTFYYRIAKWKRIGLWCCIDVGALIFIVTTILHFTGVAHYPKTLSIFHLYILLSFVYIFLTRILFSRNSGLQEKVIANGLGFFLFLAIMDLFRYNLLKYFGYFESYLNMTFLPIGALILVFSLVAGFLVYVYSMVKEKSEKDVLAQLAYRDVLTGLYNRAKCEAIFEVLDNSVSDYAIVSIDMNGLKTVNDSYGHSAGDSLLSHFAKAFKKAFDGIGTAIRMGGDEFVAVVRSEHLKDLDEAIEEMKRQEKIYSSDLPVELDAAYGIAFRGNDGSVKAMDVYRMADAKMYQMKVASKKNRT